jgi:replication-associated recombination protein RarA
VKAATAGLINLDEMTEEILSGIAEGLAKASLEEFQAAKKSISEFRTQLEQFAKAIEDDAPIIIFVDELDRCRPP